MKLDMNIDEYLPLREVVFHTLRKAIIQGELQPGERLMEVTLANKLGVSRTPVREAIRMPGAGRSGCYDSAERCGGCEDYSA